MKELSHPWISSSKPAPTLTPSHGPSPAQQVVVVVVVVVEVAVALVAVEEVHLPPQPAELLLLLVAALAVVGLPLLLAALAVVPLLRLVDLAVVGRQLPIWLLSAITYRRQLYPQQTPRPRAHRPQSVAAANAAAVRCPAPTWCPI